MTKAAQKIFNRSARHVLEQGEPSTSNTGFGAYHTNEGLGCGMAPFILNYDTDMEFSTINELMDSFPLNMDPVLWEVPGELLDKIQGAHDIPAISSLLYTPIDKADFISKYKSRMYSVAAQFNLDTKVLS